MNWNGLQRSYLVPLTILAVAAFVLGVVYLDPGTGTMIVQIILGGIAGLAVAGKLFWSQITDFFRDLFGRGKRSPSETTTLPSEEPEPNAGKASRYGDNKQ